MAHTKNNLERLTARAFLYRMFQSCFGTEPTATQFDAILGETTMQCFKLQTENPTKTDTPAQNSEWDECLAWLAAFTETYHANTSSVTDRLTAEYTRLFLGPMSLPAPPWESVYREKGDLLFQQCTRDVRDYYARHHLLPAEYPHVADDHVALEMDFMAQLSCQLLEAAEREQNFEENRGTEEKRLIASQITFLEEHLTRWLGSYAERMKSAEDAIFYPTMAALANLFAKEDLAYLHTLL